VGFSEAITEGVKNAFQYQGRASLSAFWWLALGAVIVEVVFSILDFALHSTAFGLLFGLVGLAVFLVMLSAAWRRLHDTDKAGPLALLWLIPFVGWIPVVILCAMAGTAGPNRFGNKA
jgi:uncharacterized membrane protein YhaH (DUF805 family)